MFEILSELYFDSGAKVENLEHFSGETAIFYCYGNL